MQIKTATKFRMREEKLGRQGVMEPLFFSLIPSFLVYRKLPVFHETQPCNCSRKTTPAGSGYASGFWVFPKTPYS